MLKVCSLVARDALFHEFKNKIEICNAITEVNFFFLSTVTRRLKCTSYDSKLH